MIAYIAGLLAGLVVALVVVREERAREYEREVVARLWRYCGGAR